MRSTVVVHSVATNATHVLSTCFHHNVVDLKKKKKYSCEHAYKY